MVAADAVAVVDVLVAAVHQHQNDYMDDGYGGDQIDSDADLMKIDFDSGELILLPLLRRPPPPKRPLLVLLLVLLLLLAVAELVIVVGIVVVADALAGQCP